MAKKDSKDQKETRKELQRFYYPSIDQVIFAESKEEANKEAQLILDSKVSKND